jgi:hypothetical protein
MPAANCDNPQNNLTLTNFFGLFAAGTAMTVTQRVTAVMALFSGNNPSVGITDNGPTFTGTDDVEAFFTRLFTVFSPIVWLQQFSIPGARPIVVSPRLYSNDQWATPTISVQTWMQGTHVDWWFPKPPAGKPSHYSPPLSDIKPTGKITTIAASAVFALDGHLISRLWIYLDRYKIGTDLNPQGAALLSVLSNPASDLIVKRLLEEPNRRGKD